MPRHTKEIVRLEGGNEYREGRIDGSIRPYNSEERKQAYQNDKWEPLEDPDWPKPVQKE